MKRVADLPGGGARSWAAALILQSLLFGSMHFYLGVGGMISATIGTMFFGHFFLLSRRNLWPVIVAHGLWDSLALITIYSSGGLSI
jgi:membrane protease YdiL (CAAX protease family)